MEENTLTGALLDIRDVLNENDAVVFVGAGISKDLPSDLPMANQMKRMIINDITDNLSCIEEGLRKDYYDFIDEIMMEKLLNIISQSNRRLLDEYLEIYKSGNPNHYHIGLSELVRRNLINNIITTNFDELIEQCNDELICHYDLSKPFNENEKNILKIHGSVSQIQSLIATLDDMGVHIKDEGNIRIKKVIDNNYLIFFGWRNNDPSIDPIINKTKPRKIFWFKHSSGEGIEKVFSGKVLDDSDPLKYILRNNDTIIIGNTSKYFDIIMKLLKINTKDIAFSPNKYTWQKPINHKRISITQIHMMKAGLISLKYPSEGIRLFKECIPLFGNEMEDNIGKSSVYTNLVMLHWSDTTKDIDNMHFYNIKLKDTLEKIDIEDLDYKTDKIKVLKNKVIMHRNNAIYHKLNGNFVEAKIEIKISEKIALKYKDDMPSVISPIYETKGNIYVEKKEFQKALQNHQKQLKWKNNLYGKAKILLSIGEDYLRLNQKSKAIGCFKESHYLASRLHDNEVLKRLSEHSKSMREPNIVGILTDIY